MDLCLKEFKGDPKSISIKLQKRLLHLTKDLGTWQGGRTPSLLLLLLLLLLLFLIIILIVIIIIIIIITIIINGLYVEAAPQWEVHERGTFSFKNGI